MTTEEENFDSSDKNHYSSHERSIGQDGGDVVEEENYDGTDRLSLLPDAIIHRVLTLSSIDTKKAIQLGVLSTRWRYLWKSLPCIDITNYGSRSFSTFVDKVITLRDLEQYSNDVHTFTLNCDYASIKGELVDKLASFLLRRNVQKVHIGGNINLTNAFITSLASRVKMLKLSWVNIVNEEESDRELRLTSSSLEQFDLNSEHCFKSIIINAPRLKKLMINRNFCYMFLPGCELRICAPELLFLHLQGILFTDCFLEDHSSLIDVHIDIQALGRINDREEARCLNKLFRLLVRAKSLTLKAYTFQVYGELRHMWEAVGDTFPYLKYMKIYGWNTKNHIHTLAKFTDRFSSLETLVLENTREYDPDDEQEGTQEYNGGRFWDQQLAFDCSYPKLTSVEIQFLKGDENEMIFIEFLLKSAPALENITIKTIKPFAENELERLKYRDNLLCLPSYSSNVRISVS